MSDKHPIDELFKKRLEEHSITPSEGAWAKIEAATQAKSTKTKPLYLMRAAVVALLIGVSGWVYFQNNTQALIKPGKPLANPVLKQHEDPTGTPAKGSPNKPNTTQEPPAQEEPSKPAEPAPKKRNSKQAKGAVPVLQTPSGVGPKKVFYLENDRPTEEPQKEEAQEAPQMNAEDNRTEESRMAAYQKPVKIKLRYSKPVSEQWQNEAEDVAEGSNEAEEDKDFKERLFAYANDQYNNIKTGKGLELPKKPKGKPKLEINLDKIF